MKPGDVVADRFEIERLAGSGGMGAVYRARDRRTGGAAALKVLWAHIMESAEHSERFSREAALLQQLGHPGIVRYIAHGETQHGEPWLALEWLEGESLAHLLRRRTLTAEETLAVAKKVANALAEAHRLGIVHRDIKPSNLFLPDRSIDNVRVLDFGIARVAGGAALTMTGMVVGTPFYMAPEQARGDRNIDPRADLFSLGCVLFHCLTGKAPFAGEEIHAALLRVVLEDAPRLSDVRDDIPEPIDALVASLLSRAASGRPRDAADLERRLDAILALDLAAAPKSIRPSALTGRELRLSCAVLVELPDGLTWGPASSPASADEPPAPTSPMTLPATLQIWEGDPRRGEIEAIATGHQGHVTHLPEGALLVTFGARPGDTTRSLEPKVATDLAAQAARCALALRAALPGAPMALVAGRSMSAGRAHAPDAMEHAAHLLAHGRDGDQALIRIDEVIAGLLGARFDVGGDRVGLVLRGARDKVMAVRTLLGKPTPFVGRERELAILEAVVDESASEPCSRAVVVTAVPGVGKSRLIHELVTRLVEVKRPGAHGTLPPKPRVAVWSAEGDPMSAGSPFGIISRLLRRESGVLEGEPRDVRRQKLRARAGRHLGDKDVTRVSEFLGEIAGVPFQGKSVELTAARQDPVLMGDQMRRAFEDFVEAEVRAQPLVVVLEDLHWGDLPSVKILDGLLRRLAEQPFAVIATGRPELHDQFPKLWIDRGVQEVRLLELGKRGSEKLVRAVLGQRVDDATVARIVEHAAGNAFYLEELIRAAAEGTTGDLPASVLAMVEARLEAISTDARRVLRAASVFGQVFWRGGLTALLGGDKAAATITSALRELSAQEIIARRDEAKFPGEDEHTFRHSLFREAAYRTLTDADRALGHRMAATWLVRAGEREALVLAEHFERGEEHEQALGWFRRASEQALEGDDFSAAIARAERGAAYASGELLGALRLLSAEAYKWMGSAAAAEEHAAAAMQRLPVGSPLWYVAASETASMRLRLGRHDALAEVAKEVLAVGIKAEPSLDESPHTRQVLRGRPSARVHGEGSGPAGGPSAPPPPAGSRRPMMSSLPPAPTMASAHSAVARLAGSLLHDGHLALAEALITELDRVTKASSAEGVERDYLVSARLYALHASRALCYGDPLASLSFTERSIPCFAIAGDQRNACLGRVNAGVCLRELGAFEVAERGLGAALADAERMGLSNVVALARQNLAPVLAARGAFDDAERVVREAIAAFVVQQNRRQEARGHAYLARVLSARGDHEGAEREAVSAGAIAAPIPPLFAFARAVLAEVRLAVGDAEGALAAAREGMDPLSALGAIEEGESLLRLTYAEALDACGLRDAAEDAIMVAKKRILSRGERIAELGWKESFYRHVPENARTIALAKEWGQSSVDPA